VGLRESAHESIRPGVRSFAVCIISPFRRVLQNAFTCCYLHTLCNNDSVTTNHAKKLLKLSREHGILRPRDLQPAGIPRAYLKQLVDRGELLKTGRGLYVSADAQLTENQSLAETAKLVPNGVVCLLSALRFHGLTTENPGEVWIAIHRGARPPKSGVPALRVMWFSGKMLTEGIQKHVIQGVTVPVYSVAKTVADCFRFRHRIGVNIAVEALRDAWQNKKVTSDELWRCAKVCRVLNVMRPYFDSLA
jgi:predicted transcriptional regulator of viral defense system